ncbi:alpha-L-fucosidase [Flavobacterium faecale]|uniref:alpha-L-fucosidase n=1 Tax=Flavobacterium faecale TaxID=1355330 RepID=A0A2S1LGB4_9FLAO|nr:alpha-L-fucosidase [Flavobacterium faecale]AWG22794.1 alpha-L-fucosidase [Flavobacterium faecale]
MKKRTLTQWALVLFLSASLSGQAQTAIAPGPFKATDESLEKYQFPEWFRDAKFGIWSHWGPQAVPRQGDWYAKKMYQEGSPDYKYHLEHYGHPSKFGYKDIIGLWKAEKFNPEQLMALYKKAGAKYFVSMGTHHDNFFLWDSKLHDWNSVKMGPKKDIVKLWQDAAKKEGLKFGVSEHLGASYTWWQTNKGADKKGPMAGIPYDGNDPKYVDLYHKKLAPDDKEWMTTDPESQQEWLARINELVNTYKPDLLYSDSKLPFGDVGRAMIANFYNTNLEANNGKLEAIYNCKEDSKGKWVEDMERGVMDEISPYPWQTDTSIGDWYYKTGQEYKTATYTLQMLCDIVSKNGNLLINIVQTPEGDIEGDLLKALDEIGTWIATNGEGIYGTRPWKVFGERPVKAVTVKTAKFNEKNIKYAEDDIRFTTKGENILYAFCLEQPTKDVRIKSLGINSKLNDKKIANISILGSKEKLKWKVEKDALVISKPTQLPNWRVIGIKIEFKQ